MSKHMHKCEKRERDRQRKWRNTYQGQFESSFLSLDAMGGPRFVAASGGTKPAPPDAWLSDRGKGVEDIITACDFAIESVVSYLIPRIARMYLKIFHPRLVRVFDLVLLNGKNRKESIWQMIHPTSSEPSNGTPQRCDIGITSTNC